MWRLRPINFKGRSQEKVIRGVLRAFLLSDEVTLPRRELVAQTLTIHKVSFCPSIKLPSHNRQQHSHHYKLIHESSQLKLRKRLKEVHQSIPSNILSGRQEILNRRIPPISIAFVCTHALATARALAGKFAPHARYTCLANEDA